MMIWALPAVVVLILIVLIAWKLLRRTGLTEADKVLVRSQWAHVQSHEDLHRKLLEADAVLGKLLEKLGYMGSLADKLRAAHTMIPDIQSVWDAHKLRNRIAHETGVRLSESQVSHAMKAFDRVIRKFT